MDYIEWYEYPFRVIIAWCELPTRKIWYEIYDRLLWLGNRVSFARIHLSMGFVLFHTGLGYMARAVFRIYCANNWWIFLFNPVITFSWASNQCNQMGDH